MNSLVRSAYSASAQLVVDRDLEVVFLFSLLGLLLTAAMLPELDIDVLSYMAAG